MLMMGSTNRQGSFGISVVINRGGARPLLAFEEALIYARASTRDQELKGSLESQVEYCRKFIEEFESPIEMVVVKDIGSAWPPINQRPTFMKAIGKCLDENYILMSSETWRLTRNVQGWDDILDTGVQVLISDMAIQCIRMGADLDPERIKSIVQVGQDESEQKSQQVRRAFANLSMTDRKAQNSPVDHHSYAGKKSGELSMLKSLSYHALSGALEYILELKDRAGAPSMATIAELLNERKFRTESGNAYQRSMISRILTAYNKIGKDKLVEYINRNT